MTLRERVVVEARTWLNTPYRHCASVKGAGCDCIGVIAGIYRNLELIDGAAIPSYSPQWHLHQKGRQLLLDELGRYCVPSKQPLPGDIAVFWFGHAYSHAGIIVEWPLCIHASLAVRRVEYVDADRDPHLSRCRHLFFTPTKLAESPSIAS